MKTLNEKSDVKALAKEIIDKCKLIHPSKILEVEQLLFYLQNRKDTAPTKGITCINQIYLLLTAFMTLSIGIFDFLEMPPTFLGEGVEVDIEHT